MVNRTSRAKPKVKPVSKQARQKWFWAYCPQYFAFASTEKMLPLAWELFGHRRDEDGNAFTADRFQVRTAKTVYLEMPGPAIENRPWEHLDLCGLDLRIASEDIGLFLANIESIDRVDLGSKKKLYLLCADGVRFLVLSEADKRALSVSLREALPRARRSHQAFISEYEKKYPEGVEMLHGLRGGTHAFGPHGLVEIPSRYRPN